LNFLYSYIIWSPVQLLQEDTCFWWQIKERKFSKQKKTHCQSCRVNLCCDNTLLSIAFFFFTKAMYLNWWTRQWLMIDTWSFKAFGDSFSHQEQIPLVEIEFYIWRPENLNEVLKITLTFLTVTKDFSFTFQSFIHKYLWRTW
jgi:hypothetical protein